MRGLEPGKKARRVVAGCMAACGLALLLVAQAQGQPVIPTPSELAPRPAPIVSNPNELPPRREAPRELGKPEDELVIDVTAYELAADAPAEARAALAALTAPYVGKGKGYEDLVNAAAEVTRFLQRDLGYYLGYAYLPEQEPTGGVIRIAILEGRLDRVELAWTEGLPVRREIVEAYLARLQPGSTLRVRDVERVVFLVNDLRGLTARFDVKAGSVPGTATLVVTPQAEARWAGKVDVDANGSRFLGTERVGGLLSGNSLLGRGDALTLNALASFNGGLAFALAGYTLPIGSDGLKVGGSLSWVHYKLDRNEFPLGVNGDALNVTAYALYPWVRSRNLNLFVLGSLEHKQYTDRRDVSRTADKKRIDSLTLGTTGDFRDSLLSGGVNTYELSVAAGQVRYPAGAPAGLDDDKTYTKLIASFNRLQNLVDSRLLLYVALRAQQSFANLDTTEQFRIGGPDSVRAFAPGEGTGDSGQLATVELRLLPPESWLGRLSRETVFSLFYDAGHVTFRHDVSRRPSTFDNSASFSGAGLAVSWVRPGEYAFRMSLAKPLSGTPKADTKERDPRLYLQFTKLF
jgi:hemolysin activation/secretion protein